MPANDEALGASLFWHSVHLYGVFDRIGFDSAHEAADFCMRWSLEEPLWMADAKGQFSKREIPHLGERSSIFAIAVMASFLVWSQKGERQPAFESEHWLQICYEGWRFHQRELQAQVAQEDREQKCVPCH